MALNEFQRYYPISLSVAVIATQISSHLMLVSLKDLVYVATPLTSRKRRRGLEVKSSQPGWFFFSAQVESSLAEMMQQRCASLKLSPAERVQAVVQSSLGQCFDP